MTDFSGIPVWIAILIGLLAVGGALITLVGTIGLLRLRSFYERIHAPTLGTSLGSFFVLLASAMLFSTLQSRPVTHEILIFVFVTVTTPVTLMLLARAALYRDRAEGKNRVPERPVARD